MQSCGNPDMDSASRSHGSSKAYNPGCVSVMAFAVNDIAGPRPKRDNKHDLYSNWSRKERSGIMNEAWPLYKHLGRVADAPQLHRYRYWMIDNAHLNELKTWIEGRHYFAQHKQGHALFLYKSVWTDLELRQAAAHANNLRLAAQSELARYVKIAAQYPEHIDLAALQKHWELELAREAVPLRCVDEEYIRYADIDMDDNSNYEGRVSDGPEFRRTVAEICRLRERIYGYCKELRKAIGEAQAPGGMEGGPEGQRKD